MPASTILLIDADATSAEAISTALTARRLHRHDRRRPGRGVRARSPTTSSSIIDVVARREDRVRRLPRDPLDAGAAPRSRSCASARPTTSRSGSASSRPAPTTSWRSRSTPASSRPASRRSSSGSSARRTSPPSSRPTESPSPVSGGRSRSTARRAASGRRRSRRTSRWSRPARSRTGSSSSTSTSSSARSRRYLNVEPQQTLADVVRDEAALREPELLRTYATRHDSGLHVLAAPIVAGARRADHARSTSTRS